MSPKRTSAQYDVAIIGGGPSGSAAAITCAGAGLSVAIVDRARFPRYRAGESLHPGLEPLFESLGVGDSVRTAGFLRHAGHWISSTGSLLTFEPFGADKRGAWYGFQALGSRLDNILLAAARKAGADLIDATSVRSVRTNKAGRVVGLGTTSGEIEAGFTIDAGGGSHWLARQLKIGLIYRSPCLVARYGYVRGHCPACDDAPLFRTSHAGWSWLARIGRGVYAWTSVSLGGTNFLPIRELARLRACCRVRGAEVTWRVLTRTAGPGWFAIGDAAAVSDPSAGQGVLRAISSGMMVGHLLTSIHSGKASKEEASGVYDEWFRSWFEQTVRRFARFMPGYRP